MSAVSTHSEVITPSKLAMAAGTPDHGARLQQLAREIGSYNCQSTRLAIQIGEALLEAKAILPHGGFGKWLKDETEYSPRLAQMLMRLAELATARREVVHGLGLSVAYRLSAASTSVAVRKQILDAAESGERITLRTVDLAVRREKELAAASLPPRPPLDFHQFVERISSALGEADLLSFSNFIDAADAATLTKFRNELRLRAEAARPATAHNLLLDQV